MAGTTQPGRMLSGLIVLLCTLCAMYTAGAESDTQAPSVTVSTDSCRTTVTVVFTDSLPEDSGIDRVTVREQGNCLIRLDTSRSPVLVTASVILSNPLLDAVYALEAIDRQGNVRYIRDTLQGFTLRFAATEDSVVWPNIIRTRTACQPVRIYNTGLLPCTVTRAFCTLNTFFSVPLAQLPLTIAPGDSAALTLCFTPPADSTWHDTLQVGLHCRLLALPLYGGGRAPSVDISTDTRCGAPVRLRSTDTLLQHPILYPNPASQQTTLRFGLDRRSVVSIRIATVTGVAVASLLPATYEPGTYELELGLSHLETGLYFCEVVVGASRTVLPVQIVH